MASAPLCALKKGTSHFDVASAPTLGQLALISLRLTLSASWSDWRLDWTDPLFPFLLLALNYGFRPFLPAEFCVLKP